MKSHTDGGAAVAARKSFGDYEFHPLVKFFPPLSDAQLDELAEDVLRRGKGGQTFLKHGGIILDDPNRFEACKRAGVAVEFCEWDGVGSSAEVIGRTLIPRLHLSDSQRAAIAVPIADALSGPAAPRRLSNLKNRDDSAGKHNRILSESLEAAKMQLRAIASKQALTKSCETSSRAGESDGGRAAERAAEICHVSPRYVYEASKLRDADQGLFDQVRLGKLNLSQARIAVSKNDRSKKMTGALAGPTRRSDGDDELILGDCLKQMAALRDGGFDLVFADPPYNNAWRYDADPTGDDLNPGVYLAWAEQWMKHCARLLSPTGSMFVLIDARYAGRFEVILRRLSLYWRNTIIWHDTFPNHTDANFQPAARFLFYFTKLEKRFTWNADAMRVPSARDVLGDARRTHDKGIVPHNVWDIPRVAGNSKERVPFDDAPPQVPSLILQRCILACSNEGDRVFDPFTGNGTTWREARKLGRKFTGIERSKKYAEQARQWAGAF